MQLRCACAIHVNLPAKWWKMLSLCVPERAVWRGDWPIVWHDSTLYPKSMGKMSGDSSTGYRVVVSLYHTLPSDYNVCAL